MRGAGGAENTRHTPHCGRVTLTQGSTRQQTPTAASETTCAPTSPPCRAGMVPADRVHKRGIRTDHLEP
eukprot:2071756-Prymnesium_polylepis.1